MRPLFLLVASVLLLVACGGGVTDGADEGASAAEAGSSPSSVRIEIAPAASLTGPGPTSTTAVGEATPSSVAAQTAVSAGSVSGPRSSVVAEAVVPLIVARVAPADDAAPVAELQHPTAVGSPLVFLAVDNQQATATGWLEVRLPVQPNGTTGWVRRDEVTLFENPYRIEIDREGHRLTVLHLGQPWVETTIAVGTGATPTPVGDFYLLELLAPPDPTGPYGPYAFGLSGFSEVLDSFGGADSAIIGLHGTDDPAALGTDVSFGCIRLANDVMEQLATTLPLGTPVRIT